MTGRTHDQIAVTSAVATSTLFAAAGHPLPLEATGAMLATAYGWARAPDYTELGGLRHRTWTHYLPTGLAVALFVFIALALTLPVHVAVGAGLGTLLGWWMHSFADALTDRGCWLWKRERQVLLPDGWRIKVYTVTTTRNPLTGKATVKKRASAGERMYRHTAKAACAALVVVHVMLLGPALEVPNDGRGILAPAMEQPTR